jgi:hypothetical protein
LAGQRAIEAARARIEAERDQAATSVCRGATAAPSTQLERAALIEMTFEHICRLFLDWPLAIGQPALPAQAMAWRRRLQEPAGTLLDREIDAVKLHARTLLAAAPTTAGVRQRLQRRVRQTVACLTAVKLEPGRPGKICQLVTPHAKPATATPGAQRANDTPGEDGWLGEGRSFTARGELIHRVRLGHDALGSEVVSAWTIDAPTDRLFAANGPVAQVMARLETDGRESLERLARLVVLSFDPCVQSNIEIREGGNNDARDVAGAGHS